METVFDQPESVALNTRRLNHLVGLDLERHINNARVLEVGAGVGLLTHFFDGLGCDVVSTDGRQENTDEHKERYPDRCVKTVDLLQRRSHHHLGRFDVVFCYGVLYHLSSPDEAIEDMADICDGMLILETAVAAAVGLPPDSGANVRSETWGGGRDQSLDNIACYPTVEWVANELRKHFEHVYVPHATTDREVFVGSRHKLEAIENFVV